jgi:negative regulator of flagellin synthesis FlgM
MSDPIRGVTAAIPLGSTQPGQNAPNPPATAEAGTPTVDSADVTRAETLLNHISQVANTIPAADSVRIAELKAAVQSGTYQADPKLIAEKILQIESLLTAQGKN